MSKFSETPIVEGQLTEDSVTSKKFPSLGLKVKTIVRKKVLFFGRMGSGKTTCFRCLTDQGGEPDSGLYPATEDPQSIEQDLGDINVKFIDTVGLRGTYEWDDRTFATLSKELLDSETELNTIFICFPANRFTAVDQRILSFIQSRCSNEFKACCHVIVTHCAKWKQQQLYRNPYNPIEPLKTIEAQVQELFGPSLGNLTGRVSFVNLIDPRDAPTENSQIDIINDWAVTRIELLDVIRQGDSKVKRSRICTLLVVYFVEISCCYLCPNTCRVLEVDVVIVCRLFICN